MVGSHTQTLLEHLDDEIDDLEGALAPLLESTLSGTAAKLPLLDQAKLHILATYSVESLIFSYLRLNGIEAKTHPVFEELARVKKYFAKVKTIEDPEAGKRDLVVDKGAAARMIKHSLTGNDQLDQERATRKTLHTSNTHIKFQDSLNKRSADELDTSEVPTSITKKPKKSKKEKSKRKEKEEG